MFNTINSIGKYIKLAVKYYAVIMVVAKAYEMVAAEIRKVHNEETETDVSKN